MLTAEQTLAAQKANVDILFGLTDTALEGVEKLVELNLQAARTAMSEMTQTAKAAMAVKDPQELVALQAGLLQPAAEKASSYGRHVYDIASATGAEVSKIAEAGVAQVQQKFLAMIDGATKNAPAGSENVVAFVKSAVVAANNAFDGVQRATKQAAEVAEANLHALAESAAKVAPSVNRGRRST
jgi:phasin family protein